MDARIPRWLLCLGFIAGILLTPALWGIGRDYPLSPVIPGLPVVPAAFDAAWFVALLVLLVAFAVTGWRGLGIGVIAVTLLACVLDLNRLQPWVFQYLLLLGALVAPKSEAPSHWRFVLACTYLWSGLLKFNPFFPAVALPWLLQPFVQIGPMSGWVQVLGPGIALAEAAIGVLLFFPKTAKIAAWAGIVMHIGILLSIGPLGHSWNTVVWPWNLFMIATLAIIICKETSHGTSLQRSIYGMILMILIGVLPALSLIGWWDSYLSFALYTGNLDRGRLVNAATDLQTWAMSDLNAPAYPEARAYRSVLEEACVRDPQETLIVVRRWTLLGAGKTESYGCDDMP